MANLGALKSSFLNSLSRHQRMTYEMVSGYLQQYDDLTIEDLHGIVNEDLYEKLKNYIADPEERTLWTEISVGNHGRPASSLPQGSSMALAAAESWARKVQELQAKAAAFVTRYPGSIRYADAIIIRDNLQQELSEAFGEIQRQKNYEKEQTDWSNLQAHLNNYAKLAEYKNKYPMSSHANELDELMWNITKTVINAHNLNRYLNDWPSGLHAADAMDAIAEMNEWEEVRRSNDIIKVNDYRNSHPSSPFYSVATTLFYALRDNELEKMKQNPAKYGKESVQNIIRSDIFTMDDLLSEGLITEDSWETLQLDRDLLPDLNQLMIEDPNIEAEPGCTDIYLFGTPGTGKTCLLMGLAGANGSHDEYGSYTLNMRANGGPYASALQQYVNEGITPQRTVSKFVTTINGSILETFRKKVNDHRINLIEMSGEEFADRIAENQEVTFENMGTGSTNLLMNDNRKVFFIVVDCSGDSVRADKTVQRVDAMGNLSDITIKRRISQLDILNKFISLFKMNPELMKRVDAIHFVVTKSDMFGDRNVRKEEARKLLLEKYSGPVEMLKEYCRTTKRINYSTNYRPQVFTFSLGQFYLGDVFDFDKKDTLEIVHAIRTMTSSRREGKWWDRVRDWLG